MASTVNWTSPDFLVMAVPPLRETVGEGIDATVKDVKDSEHFRFPPKLKWKNFTPRINNNK